MQRSPNGLLHVDVSGRILGAFYRVYDALGFGFLESVYCRALAREFFNREIKARAELPIDVWYDGVAVGHFRADFLVEEKVIVEIKTSHQIAQADLKQLTNYLRCSRVQVGLVLNFGKKAEFKRLIYSNDRKSFAAD